MAFCKNCGQKLEDNAVFCDKCGTKQVSEPTVVAAPAAAAPAAAKVSNWDGGVFDTFINLLVASIIIVFTCGIATPWAICYMWKFIVSHVNIDGKRLAFDGNGAQLFGNWIKWFILTIITFGIYGFWVYPRLFQWVASHTHFAE